MSALIGATCALTLFLAMFTVEGDDTASTFVGSIIGAVLVGGSGAIVGGLIGWVT